jgi:ABC-type multidrug transport system permease subunit
MKRRIFRKLRKPTRPLVVSCILPYLKFSCDILSKSQLDNGSWSNDILATSLAMQALASFLNTVGKDSSLRNKIRLGAEFLRNSINSMSDKILQTENLYSHLDKIALDFGNAIYTIWLTKSLRDDDFLQKMRNTFLKIKENVTKFISALNNVEVTCSVLNCHLIPTFPPPPEPILEFAIGQLFSADTSPKDTFLLIATLKNLEKKFYSIINEKWNFHVSRRTDRWKDIPLSEGLEKLISDKTEEILKDEKADIATMSYCLIGINRLNIETSEIQKRTIEKLLNLFSKINVWGGELSIIDLSLFICAISESPISNIAFFPNKESGYVINAVKWFERMKSEKIKMLKSSQYTLLIVFMFVLILLTTLFSYVAFFDFGVSLAMLSILLSAFFFLVSWLSRKADKD